MTIIRLYEAVLRTATASRTATNFTIMPRVSCRHQAICWPVSTAECRPFGRFICQSLIRRIVGAASLRQETTAALSLPGFHESLGIANNAENWTNWQPGREWRNLLSE